MNEDWKKDPRIQSMKPEKIAFLSELTSQIQHTEKSALKPFYDSECRSKPKRNQFFR